MTRAEYDALDRSFRRMYKRPPAETPLQAFDDVVNDGRVLVSGKNTTDAVIRSRISNLLSEADKDLVVIWIRDLINGVEPHKAAVLSGDRTDEGKRF